jgi:hypothetical protein
MSVYVGIDVHRKRSQVAVVTEDGQVQLNKNVVNGSEPMLRLIGDLPPGTPVAFEAAFGWGWLAELLEDYGFEAHLVHPLRCTAIASARLKNDKGRRGDPGAAAAGGPSAGGLDRPAGGPAAPGAAAAPGRAGPAAHPAAEPDPRGGSRLRLRPVRQLPVLSRSLRFSARTAAKFAGRTWSSPDPRPKSGAPPVTPGAACSQVQQISSCLIWRYGGSSSAGQTGPRHEDANLAPKP